jgi:hypothetical protein
VPFGHVSQTYEIEASAATATGTRYCPAPQLQPDARKPDERPEGHAAHVALPVVDAYVPGKQSEHVLRSDAPIASDAVPTRQPTHVSIAVAASLLLNVPRPHKVQLPAVLVEFAYAPLGHGEHSVLFARLKYPGVHETHWLSLDSMSALLNVPAGHEVTFVDLVGQYEPRGQTV